MALGWAAGLPVDAVARIRFAQLDELGSAVRAGVVAVLSLDEHALQRVAIRLGAEAEERLTHEELGEMRRRDVGEPHPLEP